MTRPPWNFSTKMELVELLESLEFHRYIGKRSWPEVNTMWTACGKHYFYGGILLRDDGMYGVMLDCSPAEDRIIVLGTDDVLLEFSWSRDDPTALWIPELRPGMEFGVAYSRETFEERARRSWDVR